MRRSRKAQEQIHVPHLSGRQVYSTKDADAFEYIFDSGVELSNKGRACRLLPDSWFPIKDILFQREKFVDDERHCLKLNRDLFAELIEGHSSTLPCRSIIRVKCVDGSSGTKSSGMFRACSKRAPSSYSFQPSTPAHARSRSRAVSGESAALPNTINLLAPYSNAICLARSSLSL